MTDVLEPSKFEGLTFWAPLEIWKYIVLEPSKFEGLTFSTTLKLKEVSKVLEPSKFEGLTF